METLALTTFIKIHDCERAIHKALKNEGLIFLYLINIEPCDNFIEYSIESSADSELAITPITGTLKDTKDMEAPYIHYLNNVPIDCSKTKLMLKTSPRHKDDSNKIYWITLSYKKFENGDNRRGHSPSPSMTKVNSDKNTVII